jgi:NADH-quinone oxidoreductase subunit E
MAKKKTKPNFIGLKMTPEELELLNKLQESLNLSTRTEVLLKGLESLARSSDIDVAAPENSAKAPLSLAETNLHLARLESEARRITQEVQQARNRTKEVTREVAQELYVTDEIIKKYEGDRAGLIQALLELQQKNNWLSENALQWVSSKLGVPLSQIYHAATFYKAFSLEPRGRHSLTVCLGTACQVRGAPRLLDRVSDLLKLKPGETSRDMRFTLNAVNCLGCCALGPVMVLDGKYYSKPTTEHLEKLVSACN